MGERLYDAPLLRAAVRRYELYWLPLKAAHPEKDLTPPIDIEVSGRVGRGGAGGAGRGGARCGGFGVGGVGAGRDGGQGGFGKTG